MTSPAAFLDDRRRLVALCLREIDVLTHAMGTMDDPTGEHDPFFRERVVRLVLGIADRWQGHDIREAIREEEWQ